MIWTLFSRHRRALNENRNIATRVFEDYGNRNSRLGLSADAPVWRDDKQAQYPIFAYR